MVPIMEKREQVAGVRFGVYLSQDEARWLNETRGRFLLKYGEDVSTTSIVRAGIEHLRGLDEGELTNLLKQHRGRRRNSARAST